MELDQILDRIYPLTQCSKLRLKEHITEVSLPKSHIVLKAGQVEHSIYFIKKGIVRAYANHDGNEITFWFGQEGDTIVSMRSYVEQKKGYEDISLLENCELYKISSKALNKLFQEDIELANWGRKFAECELIKTEQRLISQQFQTASERYDDLVLKTPELLNRVKLGHIASYLGITQVSLSRIRATLL